MPLKTRSAGPAVLVPFQTFPARRPSAPPWPAVPAKAGVVSLVRAAGVVRSTTGAVVSSTNERVAEFDGPLRSEERRVGKARKSPWPASLLSLGVGVEGFEP